MRKVAVVLFVMAMVLMASPAYAQAGEAAAPAFGNWSLSAIGLGIAVAFAAIGQGRVASAACEGMARNPAARPAILLSLILGLAFIESLVLFMWVMVFLRGQ